jgi:hypothetical protein
MNILKKVLIAGGCAAIIALGTNTVMAQNGGGGGGGGGAGQGGRGGRGGGGFGDPAQRKQQFMDEMKDQWEIKDDAEGKKEWEEALEPKLDKVYEARNDYIASIMRGAFGRGGGGRRGGGGNADDNGGGQRQRQRGGGPMGAPSAAVEALQKAFDDKAPTAEIKAKLKAVQDEQKAKMAAWAAASDDLRSVLTSRREAVATLHGLLQ